MGPQELARMLRARFQAKLRPVPMPVPEPVPQKHVSPKVLAKQVARQAPTRQAARQATEQAMRVLEQQLRPKGMLRAAEAFTGGGLFSIALHVEGIDVVETCEYNRFAVESLRNNLYEKAIVRDALTWMPPAGLDLLCGGPPCQPWSKAGSKEGPSDIRNMYPRILEWIEKARPKVVCLENSNEIVKDERFIRYFKDHWWKPLAELGYEGTTWDLDAANYGTPQHRLRAFVVAWERGAPQGEVLRSPPPATHGQPGSKRVVAGDLLPWVHGFDRLASGCCGGYALFDCRNLGNLNRACETCAAGGDLPAHYDPVPDAARGELSAVNRANLGRDKGGRPRVFSFPPTDIGGADAWTEYNQRTFTKWLAPVVVAHIERGIPSGVITTPKSVSRDRVDRTDPVSVRKYIESLAFISVRDAAKLQDVPQWYEFAGNHKNDQFTQIGNGIPVNLGRAVARHVVRSFGLPVPMPGSLAAAPEESGLWPIDRLDMCAGFPGVHGYPGDWQPPQPQTAYGKAQRPLPTRQAWDRAVGQGQRTRAGVAMWQDRDGDGEPQTYLPDRKWRPIGPTDFPAGFIDFDEFYGWVQGEDEEVYAKYAEMYGWDD